MSGGILEICKKYVYFWGVGVYVLDGKHGCRTGDFCRWDVEIILYFLVLCMS